METRSASVPVGPGAASETRPRIIVDEQRDASREWNLERRLPLDRKMDYHGTGRPDHVHWGGGRTTDDKSPLESGVRSRGADDASKDEARPTGRGRRSSR